MPIVARFERGKRSACRLPRGLGSMRCLLWDTRDALHSFLRIRAGVSLSTFFCSAACSDGGGGGGGYGDRGCAGDVALTATVEKWQNFRARSKLASYPGVVGISFS